MASNRYGFQPVVLLAFAALVVLFSLTRYADYDLWWHLKLGESVFLSGKPFFADTFSYTFAGKPQFAGEWLADLVIFLAYHWGGIAGVNLLKALVLLAATHFLYRTLRLGSRNGETGFAAAVVTLVVVLFALRFRLFVRPYLFSLFFVSFFLHQFFRYRAERKSALLLLLLPAQALWANMSVGAIFGPLLFGLFALDDVIRHRQGLFRHAPYLAGLFLCTLATPETWRIYALGLNLSSDPYRALVGEYQPMNRQILWGFGLKYTLGFQILAVGGALWFLALRGWRDLMLLSLFVVFLAESFLQVRMVEFFSLVAAPAFAGACEAVLAGVTGWLPNRRVVLNALVLAAIIAIVPLSVLHNTTYVLGNDVKPDAFPEEALAFLERERVGGRMFNSYAFGGYAVWRAPERKVFIDGRYRRLYTPAFYGRYSAMLEKAEAWEAADREFGFDYALVEYDLLSRRFPLHLNDNPAWALVYWDNHSAVYLKRTAANRELIAAREYRLVKPRFYDFSYLDAIRGDAALGQAVVDITREIALNPANQEPLLARAFLLFKLGPLHYDEVRRDLEAAGRLKPDLAMKHSALAYLLLDRGEQERATAEVRKALALDPLDAGAINLANRLGIKVELPKGVHH